MGEQTDMDILLEKIKTIDTLATSLLSSFNVEDSKKRNALIEECLQYISSNFKVLFKDVVWKMCAEPAFQITCSNSDLKLEVWQAFSALSTLETRNSGCNLFLHVDAMQMRIVTNKNGNYVSVEAGTSDPYTNLDMMTKFITKQRIRLNKDAIDKWASDKIKLLTLANSALPSASQLQSLGDFKNE
jgi:hypothetical protein